MSIRTKRKREQQGDNMRRRYIIWTATLLCTVTTDVLAQATVLKDSTLNRTVVVENQYNPDIMNASKVNILPTIEEPQATQKAIDYATERRPSERFHFKPMPNFGTTPEHENSRKGYLRAGYGTNGNVDVRLSYRTDWSKRDQLNALLAFRGIDGTIDRENAPEWEARAYRTLADIDWTHRFNTLTLKVAAGGENQVFNYPIADRGHQHNQTANLQATLASNRRDDDIRFSVGTGLLYAKQKYAFRTDDAESYTEYIIRTHALVSGDINERTCIQIAAQMDNFFITPGGDYDKVSNTSLQLNPYLTCEGKQWKTRIGMHIDPFFRKGNTDLSLAPDLYGEYSVAKGYSLYLQVGGGRVLNDFRSANLLDPYVSFPPYIAEGAEGEGFYCPTHAYNQLDGSFGLRATPMNELHLHLYGGYRMTEDQLFAAYTPEEICCRVLQDAANVLYTGVSAQYSWKDFFTTRAGLEWSKWDSDLFDSGLPLIPELSFRWSADMHPISGLTIGASYRYERYSECKARLQETCPETMNDLSITASYCIVPQLTVYATGNNLFDCSYSRYVGIPAQGIHFLAGAAIEF